MSRPGGLVRADTLDLQDQDNPTAAEHQKHPGQNGVAPHQASELHHVQEERQSEEQTLHEAWDLAGKATGQPDAQAGTIVEDISGTNGAHRDSEDGEGGESEADADDDMMDRISSSPSIDDGGYYPLLSPPRIRTCQIGKARLRIWPARSSSLSPSPTVTPTKESFNSSASSTCSTLDSSPFLHTPQHLPIQVRKGDYTPDWIALGRISDLAVQHGLAGGYGPGLEVEHGATLNEHDDAATFGSSNEDEGAQSEASVLAHEDLRPIESPFRKHDFQKTMDELMDPPAGHLEQSPSLTSIASFGSAELRSILLPVDDPLLDRSPSPTLSTTSTSSWESADTGSEDIDFEFVYALHTFVATVEGQANATKGDTMVLLDDSNSYWWLVRVVKDSSIGYLPAEHIETPTERLARLNKHRNIDLSATMLSDNSEKTRNPLKIAMRRRNAKTVQFAAPTYVEASDYDYSTDEEDQAMADSGHAVVAAQTDEPQHSAEVEEVGAPDARAEDGEERAMTPTHRASFEREQIATHTPAIDEPQLSPRLVDKTEAAPLKSKKGRNRDSFLKDETETKKISLTPGLLREDSASTKSVSSESVRNISTENLVKQISPPEATAVLKKDGKDKKKEKQKGGMLSGLFKSKKKDKKALYDAGVESDMEKPSLEIKRAPSPRASPQASSRNSPVERSVGANAVTGNGSGMAPMAATTQAQQPLVQAQSQAQTQSPLRPQQQIQNQQQQAQVQPRSILQTSTANQDQNQIREAPNNQQPKGAIFAELAGSEAAYEMSTGQEAQIVESHQPVETPAQQQQKQSEGTMSSIRNMLSPSSSEPKPLKAKRSKDRVELDDFDSADDGAHSPNPFLEQEERQRRASGDDSREAGRERLSESPVQITTSSSGFGNSGAFMQGSEIVHIPTPGEGPESDEASPTSLTSSPSIIEHPDQSHLRGQRGEMASPPDDDEATPTAPRSLSPQQQQPQPQQPHPNAANHPATVVPVTAAPPHSTSIFHTPPSPPPHDSDTASTTTTTTTTTPSTPSTKEQQWSDTHLRSWLDDGSEVKEMLILINDKSDVVPVGNDHPIMMDLFKEERKGLERMRGELDGLLGGYLARRGVALG
ncbi:hypothetical protein LTR62_007154 [Meristemomyces frigidus]|uniref:SH3 domain-containing protein n=1 Tax=Meristemomyces frigidus TaxID=1508187 RepID=A0AAN7TBT8_9PEZI|nr:hypothetical protein LTR62_007154 [Meristemomyces frigidus]